MTDKWVPDTVDHWVIETWIFTPPKKLEKQEPISFWGTVEQVRSYEEELQRNTPSIGMMVSARVSPSDDEFVV